MKRSKASAKGRRSFLKTLGATSLLPSLLAGCRQSAKPNKNANRPAASTEAEIQALIAVIRCRHGSKLTDQQLEALGADIESNLKSRKRLNLVRLKNSDEPDVIFRPII